MLLRKFLYLDTALVDDYLSQLEGYVVEGPIDQTDTVKGTKGGKLGINSVLKAEGSAGAESTSETRQRRVITPRARFQQLYKLLEEEDSIQPLDAFDPDIVSQLRRGEVLEIEALLRVPEIFLATDAMSGLDTWLTSFSELADTFGLEGVNPLAVCRRERREGISSPQSTVL
jgi:hypothetical protein